MTKNEKAFLDMIALSEGTSTIENSDNGYDVVVGGTLFENYSDHPRKLVTLNKAGLKSTAAGRYQLLARYFDFYKKKLGLSDFSPASQDAIALQQIKESNALPYVNAGRFEEAVKKCAHIWASLPGAGYGQRENELETLKTAYVKAGGEIKEA